MQGKKKHGGGRPPKMTEITVKKLDEVFAIGGTDLEACAYAGISHQALYNYQKKHPKYVEHKEALKEKPILLARRTIVNALHLPENARWYLERKKRDEFSTRIEQDMTGQPQTFFLGLPPSPFMDGTVRKRKEAEKSSVIQQSKVKKDGKSFADKN